MQRVEDSFYLMVNLATFYEPCQKFLRHSGTFTALLDICAPYKRAALCGIAVHSASVCLSMTSASIDCFYVGKRFALLEFTM